VEDGDGRKEVCWLRSWNYAFVDENFVFFFRFGIGGDAAGLLSHINHPLAFNVGARMTTALYSQGDTLPMRSFFPALYCGTLYIGCTIAFNDRIFAEQCCLE
jgi:hypothetical protein